VSSTPLVEVPLAETRRLAVHVNDRLKSAYMQQALFDLRVWHDFFYDFGMILFYGLVLPETSSKIAS